MSIKANTERLFADSFEKLLEMKSFDQISVSDITRFCGASRATFYRYFRDKYDLMNWIFKTNVDMILIKYPDIRSWPEVLIGILQFIVGKKMYFYSIMKYKEQNSFLGFLTDYSFQYLHCQAKTQWDQKPVPKQTDFAIKNFCLGSCHMVQDWVISGCLESVEEMTRLIFACIPHPWERILED